MDAVTLWMWLSTFAIGRLLHPSSLASPTRECGHRGHAEPPKPAWTDGSSHSPGTFGALEAPLTRFYVKQQPVLLHAGGGTASC